MSAGSDSLGQLMQLHVGPGPNSPTARMVVALGRHAIDMRIFISSVTAGLEEERRALPAQIRALGHEPVMFEDFGAQTVPSRQACLDAVATSDVYLLLLGPHYGYQFPETDQSATHDEFVEARNKGIRPLVFRKDGVTPHPDQAAFIKMVGDYAAGAFWDTYTQLTELLTKVTAAVRSLESALSPLSYEPLTTPPTITWRNAWEQGQTHGWGDTSTEPTFVETHVSTLDGIPWTVRQLHQLPDALIGSLRTFGAVSMAAGVDQAVTDEQIIITVPDQGRPSSHHDVPSQFRGLRVARAGQVSWWSTTPRGQIGAHITAEILTSIITEHLRQTGSLNILRGTQFAISAGLGGSMVISTGPNSGTVIGLSGSDQTVRVTPDESVSDAAFALGATEVASAVARRLFAAITR